MPERMRKAMLKQQQQQQQQQHQPSEGTMGSTSGTSTGCKRDCDGDDDCPDRASCAEPRCNNEPDRPPLTAKKSIFARPNVRALTTMLTLSAAWVVAQMIGGVLANSTSLISDAQAMCVDVVAYGFNLVSEVRPESERSIKLAAPLVSAAILLAVTAGSLSAAASELAAAAGNATSEGDADEDVDGAMVLGFGGAMLLVDAAMVAAVMYRGAAATNHLCRVNPRTEVNLFSALSHVLADTLRSFTQCIVGAAILLGGNSTVIDAFGTFIISVTILLGALYLLWNVALQGRDLCRGQLLRMLRRRMSSSRTSSTMLDPRLQRSDAQIDVA